MAAVTVVGSPVYNVVGSRRSQLYRVTGNTTNTLDIGLRTINEVNVEPNATNSPTITFAALSPGPGTRITFTSGGAFTNVGIEIIGA